MNVINRFLHSSVSFEITVAEFLLHMATAFIVGQGIAWCYMLTHRGMSYSRGFVQSLVLLTLVTSMVMSVLGNNLVTAFGLLGALSIIRFRTPVRDTRDTAFIFLALSSGMATGTGFHVVALAGAAIVCAVAGYLYWVRFGARMTFDALLQFEADTSALEAPDTAAVLKRFCSRREVTSVIPSPLVDAGEAARFDCAYQIRLRDSQLCPQLVAELEAVKGIHQVHLHLQQETDEV